MSSFFVLLPDFASLLAVEKGGNVTALMIF